jgi:hypothetical protein
MEQKLAAYRYMINHMSSLPLSPEQQNIEWQTMLDIANSNNFPEHIITKLRTTTQNPNKTSVDDNKQKKMDHLHLPFSKKQKSYQPVQTN